jgi:hypothetical protein
MKKILSKKYKIFFVLFFAICLFFSDSEVFADNLDSQRNQIEAQMGQAKQEIKKLKLLEKIETNKLYKNQQKLEYTQHSLQRNKKQYSNAQTEGKCVTCEPGSSPNNDNTDCLECPKGHACESGCLRKCDKGYYQAGIGSSSCKPCSAGQCCPITGLEEPGTCRAGYYCQYVTDDCNDIPCPEGNYCPAGRQNPWVPDGS